MELNSPEITCRRKLLSTGAARCSVLYAKSKYDEERVRAKAPTLAIWYHDISCCCCWGPLLSAGGGGGGGRSVSLSTVTVMFDCCELLSAGSTPFLCRRPVGLALLPPRLLLSGAVDGDDALFPIVTCDTVRPPSLHLLATQTDLSGGSISWRCVVPANNQCQDGAAFSRGVKIWLVWWAVDNHRDERGWCRRGITLRGGALLGNRNFYFLGSVCAYM